jgi:signal transduction histidine kinase
VACAEHELRGPLAALTLAAGRSAPLQPDAIRGQLERARLALSDMAAARCGRRALPQAGRHELRCVAERTAAGWRAAGADVTLDWQAGDAPVHAEPARLAQALGNLLSNALEHGGGRAAVRGLRNGASVRVEVVDQGPGFGGTARRPRGRGRGMAIAARAIEEAGGRLGVASSAEGAVVALELPVADA